MRFRGSVASDFDGVLHSYTSPWVDAHVIPDPVVPGAIEWLNDLHEDFDLVVQTTRGRTPEGCAAALAYLKENGLEVPVIVTAEKLPCLVYVDDRGWRFEGPGTYPTRQQVHDARPWNKR